jgi:hypothetical protein
MSRVAHDFDTSVVPLGIPYFSDEFALLDFLDSRYNPSRFTLSNKFFSESGGLNG